ncbi:MAG: Fe-S cluster assembly protein SufD [Pseudomonadota bacterium]|nr:Fe-S cluster assembly protein SufD [Pseudomonadota bacterium]
MNDLSTASETFVSISKVLDGDVPWLKSMRQDALNLFSAKGLPTLKDEEWKYTSLRHLDSVDWGARTEFNLVAKFEWLVPEPSCKLVFVNGTFQMQLSEISDLPPGAFIGSLKEAITTDLPELKKYVGKVASSDTNSMVALNTANIEEGFVVFLNKVRMSRPIEIIHLSQINKDPIVYHPRNLVVLNQGSEAIIIERSIGSEVGDYFVNSTTELYVENKSDLKHHRVYSEGSDGVVVANNAGQIGEDSEYTSLNLSLGGKVFRSDLEIKLAGLRARTLLGGIYLTRGEEHSDHTTSIEHKMGNTISEQLFKGVLTDQSRAVFQGNIIVREGADGSDGSLNNRTILLSPETEINSKPQLEIYVDDVKCSHGSTVGELDDDLLFYLRSRGIPENEARSILVEGFLSEVISRFDLGSIEDIFRSQLEKWTEAL